MASWVTLHEHHKKAIRVVLSCKNLEQLVNAEKFCILVIKFHMKDAVASNKKQREFYMQKMQESEELMKKALWDHKFKLARIKRKKTNT